MNFSHILNIISNIIIFVSMLMFTLFVFGRKNSKIYKFGKIQATILKIALASVCTGNVSNIFSSNESPISEIALNIGFAFLFVWAAYFHYIAFIKPSKKRKR